MKKLPAQILRTGLLSICACFVLFCMAEYNYNSAIKQARQTEGSDALIGHAMAKNGIYINANDPNPPSIFVKVKALFIY